MPQFSDQTWSYIKMEYSTKLGDLADKMEQLPRGNEVQARQIFKEMKRIRARLAAIEEYLKTADV